jgi:hypothetical protein
MTSSGERIAASAWGVIFGTVPEPRNEHGNVVSGLCLAQTRIVIEHALWNGERKLYATYLSERAHDKPAHVSVPWARDLEASMRARGLALDLPRTGPRGDEQRYVNLDLALDRLDPGDILFRWDTAPFANGVFIGHVAVYLGRGLMLENARPASRPWLQHRGPTLLTHVGCWPITTVARIPG